MNKWGRMSETKLPSEPENQGLPPQPQDSLLADG